MKKSSAITLIAALTVGAVGLTSLTPALARGNGGGDARLDFDLIDTNGDGKITVEEMEAHRANRFAEQDTDGDGSLSKEELLAAMLDHASERMAKRVDRMFVRKDEDGDGKISMAELGHEDRSDHMFEHLDADDDGAISKEELEDATSRRGRKHHRHAD